MKHVAIFLAWLLCIAGAHAQVFTLYDVDASSFPLMKAKFLALDTAGVQQRPGIAELSLIENGSARTIINVSCPPAVPPKALSAVLVIDVSGSMSGGGIDMAKASATAWVSGLPLGASQCAITSFDGANYLNQDFTTDRTRLLQSINALGPGGSTDYDEALYRPMAGGLQVSQRGIHQRIIILLTDGLAPNPNTAAVIAEAGRQNCTIFCITLGMPAPQSLRDIATQTGGQYFENVTTVKEAEDVYRTILQVAQGGDPCTVEWTGVSVCSPDDVDVVLSWNSMSSPAKYSAPINSIASLKVKPRFIAFGRVIPGTAIDTVITLTAENADFTITSIQRTLGSAAFTVVKTTFPVKISKGSSENFTVRFSPTDSALSFGSFEIQTERCPSSMSASGGFPGKRMTTPTLELTHPVGGETFVVGSDTLITWKGVAPSDTVKLEYSVDGGSAWTTLTNAATGLQCGWKNIPRPASTQCRIRVSQSNSGQSARRPGTLLHTLTGHTGRVHSVTWSPDGYRVATGGWDDIAKVWDAYTGTHLFTLGPDSSGGAILAEWSPDGSRLATASWDRTTKIWDASTGLVLYSLTGHADRVHSATWSPDGNRVATASADGTSKIWDATKGALLFTIDRQGVELSTVRWSPDGNRLATASWDRTVTAKIWDALTGSLLHTLGDGIEVHFDATWSPDGRRLTTTGFGPAKIWDATTGTLLFSLEAISLITSVTWSPDGRRVATASMDGTARIWDATTGILVYTLRGHKDRVWDANWSPDGNRLATASVDNTANVWDATTGMLLYSLKGHGSFVNAATWSPDGRRVATASDDRTAKIWSIDETPLQEAVSSAFSVVMPSPLSSDVDMQQCLVGSAKDSVVADGIRNTGTYPFRTDSVFFAGADAGAFRLVSGMPPFDVAAGAARPLEFRFAPKRVGLHTADIVMITQADTLVQKIQGVGIAPSLAVINNIIDFGKVAEGQSKDTLNAVTITNVGSAPLAINATRHAGPNDVDFTTLAGGNAFTLNVGDTATVDLRFSPGARGRTSGRLLFDYNGFGSPAVVQLFAEGVGPDTARTTIAIDNINAQAGERVNLVLKLDKQSGLQLASSPTDWFARIHYNPTILFNELTNNMCVSVSNDSCTIELTGTYDPKSAMLASIPCVATLGTTDKATIAFESFSWTNGSITTETQLIDGVITITGVCEDGGVRLFIPAGSSTALASRPNPVKDELRIDYGLVSETSVTLTLTGSTGQIAQTIVSNKPHSAGRYELVHDVSSLSSGIYYLTLRTNAHTLTSRVDIVK